MNTVNEILQKKGAEVWSVGPSDSIFKALELMREKNVGAVLVVESDILLGIFSERDYARKVVLEGKASKSTAVRDAMTTKVAYVRPRQTVEECMALMTDKRIRHLPVFDGEALIGVISIGDVVQIKISEQEFIIEQLENYITGYR
jgi:CBS domain-containing protein